MTLHGNSLPTDRTAGSGNAASEAPVSDWGNLIGAFTNTFKTQSNGLVELANRAGWHIDEATLAKLTQDARPGSAAWAEQLAGQGAAIGLELLVASKLGAVGKLLSKGERPATALELVRPATNLSSMAVFGAVNGGLLTPTNDSDNFIQARLLHAVTGAGAVYLMGKMGGIEEFGNGAAGSSQIRNWPLHSQTLAEKAGQLLGFPEAPSFAMAAPRTGATREFTYQSTVAEPHAVHAEGQPAASAPAQATASLSDAGQPPVADAKPATHDDPYAFRFPDLTKKGVRVDQLLDWQRCPHLVWLKLTHPKPGFMPEYQQKVGEIGHFLADKGAKGLKDPIVAKHLSALPAEERPKALSEAKQFAAKSIAQTPAGAKTEVQLRWKVPDTGVELFARPDIVEPRGQTQVIGDRKTRDYYLPRDQQQVDTFALVYLKDTGFEGPIETRLIYPKSGSTMSRPFDKRTIAEREQRIAADLTDMKTAFKTGEPALFKTNLADSCRQCQRRSQCQDFLELPLRARMGTGPLIPKARNGKA